MTRNDLEELERQSAMVARMLNLIDGDEGIARQFDKFLEQQHLGVGPMNFGMLFPTETKKTENILHPYFIQWCFFVGVPIERLKGIHNEWAKKLNKGEKK